MDLKKYQELIEHTLDLENIAKHNKFFINSGFKPELKKFRDKLDMLDEKMEKLSESVKKKIDFKL